MLIRSIIVTIALASSAAGFSISSSFTSKNGLRMSNSYESSNLSMKIFDWKRRGDTATITAENDVENVVFTCDNITHAPGSRHRKNRVGRGISAGQGHQCGFGMRGQKSRKGPGKTAGFEGGQTPLYRRLPKFPGQPMGPGHEKTVYNVIKLHELNGVASGETCSFDSLRSSGAISKSKFDIHKIVTGSEEFTAKNIVVQAHAFTQSARAAIEANGGKCQLLKHTTNAVLEEVAV